MSKQKSRWIVGALACALLLAGGCANQNSPAATTTKGNQAAQAQQPDAAAAKPATETVDLSKELVMNPKLEIGKTTYADMIKAYGEPVSKKQVNSLFRYQLLEKGKDAPKLPELMATFKVNPFTGEASEQPYPFYFTTGDNAYLVAAPVYPLREGLAKKMVERTATLEDVKKIYGKPVREIDNAVEYYDFANKISLLVARNPQGNLIAMLTKYDLLYGSKVEDMKQNEEAMRYLMTQAEQKK
ncbi:hypothetical protein [Brevibacillus fulvus]|uniref:Lipoprotein n=1 Tax=Brevibacillus fulvus TaxID=1125967 RepID=A0A939BPH8_9BACL|nr:hypothetical protein [Brevibacillus fulvus]MBM7590490.1 hypothetical protein [Brevibacillus fulvus]